ncbi:MAG TPA: YetF domain-containing protein [Solirubrobacteraceae bacterium]|nr:YetF domain-containing protein [Solirubrobacteraceae bacterium]
MWREIFVVQVPIVEKVLRTVLVYATIVLLFRLSGKRGLATLNTLDFVVIFLLSNVVQNAIIGNDQSFSGGAIGAATLVAVNAGVNRMIARSPRAARVLEGRSTTVIEDGRTVPDAVRRLALRPVELEHAVRMQNGDSLQEMQRGVLEPSGHLILTLKPSEQGATKSDVTLLLARLDAIEARLGTEGSV